MVDNYPAKKLLPLTQEMADEVTEYRFANRFANDTDAYRALLRIALDAVKRTAVARELARREGERGE